MSSFSTFLSRPALWGALALLGCGAEDEHAPFLDEDVVDVEDCDAGSCAGEATGASARPRPVDETGAGEVPCLTEEQASEFDDPLLGTVRRFASDFFNPWDTISASGKAEIRVEAELDGFLACASSSQSGSFELYGGQSRSGPIVIRPVGEANFVSSVVQLAPRAGDTLDALPVFGLTDVMDMFEQLDTQPVNGRGQIVLEFAAVWGGERVRYADVEVTSSAGEVAYRVDGEWTFDGETTGPDGLAMIVNTNAADGMGAGLNLSYVYHAADPDNVVRLDDVRAVSDAVTYIAVEPAGATVAGGF